MDIVERTDIQAFQNKRFEFLFPGAANTTILDTVLTPQRYSDGEPTKVTTNHYSTYRLEICTFVIWMPAQGAGGPLHGSAARFWRRKDIATIRDIWNSALRKMTKCLLEYILAKQPGCTSTGKWLAALAIKIV